MTIPDQIDLEVFRTGNYGPKGTFTEGDLDAIAADYRPDTHEAPVTLDHEQNGPAHGWVTGIKRLGDRLVATIGRISPTLGAAIVNHAFKKRSIELYRQLPATGRPYLKAVSFLGAAAPEVKGLADPTFREDAGEFARFDEEPSPGRGVRARQTLIDANAWIPRWETAGILDVFDALEDGEQSQRLVEFLRTVKPPVQFGATEREPRDEVAAFAADLVGGASTQSLNRHQEALGAIRENPALDYREALLTLR